MTSAATTYGAASPPVPVSWPTLGAAAGPSPEVARRNLHRGRQPCHVLERRGVGRPLADAHRLVATCVLLAATSKSDRRYPTAEYELAVDHGRHYLVAAHHREIAPVSRGQPAALLLHPGGVSDT